MKTHSVRLSKNVIPSEYHIELKPDLKNFTFEGIETITLSILEKTKTITLHAKDLEIETAHISQKSNKIFAKISYNERNETVTFTFPDFVEVRPSPKLTIVFKGILNDKMRGFYKSSYMLGEKEHHMATTQFEATDARRAFPCFDEPAHKAVFHVSLIVPKGKTAISNTLPISISEHDAGLEIVNFAPTPKMSTYLLAFIIGDFEYLEGKTKNGVRVRVFTTPQKKAQGKFAFECAIKTLDFYEKYFDIKYPLPVLDMIAIPDFASGAMENWGAITYRESAILVDEKNSSLSNKQWVALVIAHELAHQWFGNLVTMEWWTHLWLNEGFASYIEYLAVDKLFPDWKIWTQFTVNDLGVALRLDALASTHPIEVEVHHPDEIGEIFDEVSYSKGASVIRMLADYLGEKDFRDGLRYYLKKHSYKNTETIHLWQAFEKISKKPVANIMHEWTSRPGYPVVKAQIDEYELSLSQERFFSSPISKKKNKDKILWQIPINIEGDVSTWMKINSSETGFFRTAYSRELLDKLASPIEKKTLSTEDRLGIVRDLFALSEAGTIPTTDVLNFINHYKNEDSYVVWVEIAGGLMKLEQLLSKEKSNTKLKKLILNLFSPVTVRFGWKKKKGEDQRDVLLRSLVISQAGLAGNKEIIQKAKKLFSDMKIGNVVDPDIRSAVYKIVADNGGKKEYEFFIQRYKTEKLHEEKNRLGGALGYFKDIEILKKVCEFALSKDVRPQDAVSILSLVGSNPLGRDVWWNFIKKNWQTLVSRYGEGGHTLGRAIKAISGSAEEKHLKDFQKFFSTHQAPGAKRAIEQVIEKLESNVAWLKRDKKIINNFFEENQS